MAFFGLSAAASNSLVGLLSFVYVQCVVWTADFLRVRGSISANTSRKIVHVCAACWVAWFPLFDPAHWTWVLNIAVPVVFTGKLLVLGCFGTADNPEVRTMSRTGDPSDLLHGPLYFTVLMCILGTWGFMTPQAVLVMGPLGWGDGLASIVGVKVGRHRFSLTGPTKSLEGCAAMLLFSVLGTALFALAIPDPSLTLPRILAVSALCTAVEALSPREIDNILIPIAALLVDRILPL
eukprot:TRINITY_DN1011_c0_g1_i1.p1 TRINITY_DN1011_c0_g1~~TRINITY_DN1011_c0_g1_i1.p1  ORF type:complete len:264 (+),score=89.34 TRINITY_DN1011_c0_g1_i1:86-793(+)